MQPSFKSNNAPEQKLLLEALQKKQTQRIPFWLMRQAGRYLPEYRALREKAGSFLNLCFTPDMAAEVTLQPLKRFDMDAAILFSDILVVPYALGQKLEFVEGEGPRLEALQKFPEAREIDFLAFDKKLSPVFETLRIVKAGLRPDKALIGFAGAPWTVACYMVEGQGGGFSKTIERAVNSPASFDVLIEALTTATSRYLIEQIKNGADTVQLFDSWAGLLPEAYFARWVTEPAKKITAAVKKAYPGFPVIGFPRQARNFYQIYAEQTGVDCIGLGEEASLSAVIKSLAGKTAVQGCLAPELLLAGGEKLKAGVRKVLEEAGQSPFIFNLGHGIIKETPPEHVAELSQMIKAYRR